MRSCHSSIPRLPVVNQNKSKNPHKGLQSDTHALERGENLLSSVSSIPSLHCSTCWPPCHSLNHPGTSWLFPTWSVLPPDVDTARSLCSDATFSIIHPCPCCPVISPPSCLLHSTNRLLECVTVPSLLINLLISYIFCSQSIFDY